MMNNLFTNEQLVEAEKEGTIDKETATAKVFPSQESSTHVKASPPSTRTQLVKKRNSCESAMKCSNQNQIKKMKLININKHKLNITTKTSDVVGKLAEQNNNQFPLKRKLAKIQEKKLDPNVEIPMRAKLEKIICKKMSLPGEKPKMKVKISGGRTKCKNSIEKLNAPVSIKRTHQQIRTIKKMSKFVPHLVSSPPGPTEQKATSVENINGISSNNNNVPCICEECGLELTTLQGLRHHKMLMHNPNRRTFQCPACQEKEFKSGRTLWVHYYRDHMSPDDLPPEILDLISKPPVVQQSWVDHPTCVSFSYTCEHCGKGFSSKKNLERHVHNMHGEGLRKENRVQCLHCHKEFKEKGTMMAHVRRFHEMTEITKCDLCSRDFGSNGKLWKHKVDEHGCSADEEAAAAGIKFEQCDVCGEQLLKGRQTTSHMKDKHPDQFDTWWKQELVKRRQHSLEHKRVERRKVKESGVGPNWLMREKFEKKVDTYCEICDKTLRSNLTGHLKKVHKIERQEENGSRQKWWCPKQDCVHGFTQRRNLVCHYMETHCGLEEQIVSQKIIKFVGKCGPYKKFVCTLCNSTLYDRAEVRVHVVATHPHIYTLIKRGESLPATEQICGYCAAKYSSDSNLRNHISSCHGDICWKCPECFKVMLNPGEMGQHFQEDHHADYYREEDDKKEVDASGDVQFLSIFRRTARKQVYTSQELEERLKERRKIYGKYQRIRCVCPVCDKPVSLTRLDSHVKTAHGIIEDGNLLNCSICMKNSFTKRETWLGHMEIAHGTTHANMEQLVEMARKLNVKNVDLPSLRNEFSLTKQKAGKVAMSSYPKKRGRPAGKSKNKNSGLLPSVNIKAKLQQERPSSTGKKKNKRT